VIALTTAAPIAGRRQRRGYAINHVATYGAKPEQRHCQTITDRHQVERMRVGKSRQSPPVGPEKSRQCELHAGVAAGSDGFDNNVAAMDTAAA
jgi:hypothetical protein